MGWIRPLILVFAWTGIVAAQAVSPRQGPTTLQLGTPIERTIAPGQTHIYMVNADENSFVQITVEQRGIDVVVRVLNPTGRNPREHDTPNGSEGPENVSFVTVSKSPYRIDVTPLSREPGPAGRYEIRLIEQRQATDQELKEHKGQEALKARGIELLGEIEGVIAELRLPQTRIKTQVQVAQMLWESDEKRALKYLTDAVAGFKELMTSLEPENKEYIKKYHVVANLRHEIVQMLTMRQPEMALSFVRSTPPAADPYGNQRDLAAQEATLEIEIANHIAQKDPKRTLEIARETLKSRYTSNLTNTLYTLRPQHPELAAELASEIANKLLGEKLLKDPQASSLVVNLIQMSAPGPNQGGETNGSTRRVPLLSEQQRRDLIQKALSETLAYKPPPPNLYSPERDAARSILQGLQQMGAEVEGSMNGGGAAVEKKLNEWNALNNSGMEPIQQYHNAVNDTNVPVDEVLKTLAGAPNEYKDQLYMNLANRLANSGDMARARQILNDNVPSTYHRQQALYNLEMQEMFRAISKGKVDDALRSVANVSGPQERANMLAQIVNQIGPGYKRAAALNFLDQARGLLPPSVRAEDQTQMNALFEIAKAFSRYDWKRAFEILDPLVDQFNELSTAAKTLEGFGGEFYEQDELNLQNGNAVANVATQMTAALATLALTNFDRARLTADRIRLPEVRLRAYLDIAQYATQQQR